MSSTKHFFNEMGSFLSFMIADCKWVWCFNLGDKNLREATKTGEMVSEGTLNARQTWFWTEKGLEATYYTVLRITAIASKNK